MERVPVHRAQSIEDVLVRLRNPMTSIATHEYMYRLTVHRHAFSGKEMLEWIRSNVDVASDKAAASLGQTLLTKHKVFRRINLSTSPPTVFTGHKDNIYAFSPGFLHEGFDAADQMVEDYLLYRGFMKTLSVFNSERHDEEVNVRNISRIVKHIFHNILSYDLPSFERTWHHIEAVVFSPLYPQYGDGSSAPTPGISSSAAAPSSTGTLNVAPSSPLRAQVEMLYKNLLRYYAVYCVNTERKDALAAFLAFVAPLAKNDADWTVWFSLPYMDDPQHHPSFELFFARHWLENLSLSLNNMLAFAMKHTAIPDLCLLQNDHRTRATLQATLAQLQQRVISLQRMLDDNERVLKNRARTKAGDDSADGADGAVPPLSLGFGAPDAADELLSPKTPSFLGAQRSSSGNLHATAEAAAAADAASKMKGVAEKPPPSADRAVAEAGGAGDKTASEAAGGASPVLPDVRSSGESKRLSLSGSADAAPRLSFDPASTTMVGMHNEAVTCCAASPAGDMLASASKDGIVKVWSTPPLPPPAAAEAATSGGGANPLSSVFCFTAVNALAWQPRQAKMLLCATAAGEVKVWDSAARAITHELKTQPSFPVLTAVSFASPDVFACAATAPGGKSGCLTSYDASSLQAQHNIRMDPPVASTALKFSADGSLLISGGYDGIVRSIDVRTQSPLLGWQAHMAPVISLALLENDSIALTLGADGKLSQWDMRKVTGKPLTQYVLPPLPPQARLYPPLSSMSVSADGYIAVSSAGPYASIFHVGHKNSIARVGGHTKPPLALHWCPRAPLHLLSGSVDGSVRLSRLSEERS